MKPSSCPHCGSDREAVHAGYRSLRGGKRKNLYKCRRCGRRYSNDHRSGHHSSPALILRALQWICSGYTLSQTRTALSREFSAVPSKASLSRWSRTFPLPIRSILEKILQPGTPVVYQHRFASGLPVNPCSLHLPKLRFAKSYPGLLAYLRGLPRFLDMKQLQSGLRCSEAPAYPGRWPEVRRCRKTFLNHLTGSAATLATTNSGRHRVVEDYLLFADRDTIATEVPLYYYDPGSASSFYGQLDLLQVRRGRLLLLDYKPAAGGENRGQVLSQLTHYARALHYRAGIGYHAMQCAWFDEQESFFFDPDPQR